MVHIGMKPPICCICQKNLENFDTEGLIQFKKRKSDFAWDKRVRKEHIVGHPPYTEWFCAKHFELAKKYEHLTKPEALSKIREEIM